MVQFLSKQTSLNYCICCWPGFWTKQKSMPLFYTNVYSAFIKYSSWKYVFEYHRSFEVSTSHMK